MKKFFIIIFGICVLGAAGMAFAEFSSKTSSDSTSDIVSNENTVCDLSKKTEFQLNDTDKTKFLIPDAYLYKPYPNYKIEANLTSRITLWINKKTLSPNCGNQNINSESYRMVVLEVLKSGGYKHLAESHRQHFPYFVKNEKYFSIYRKKINIPQTEWWNTKDLLVPIDQSAEPSLFFQCAKGLYPSSVDSRAGCQAYSKLIDAVYLQYNVHSLELENYKKIDSQIKAMIKSFKLGPEIPD